MYAYAANNPVKYTDPDGKQACPSEIEDPVTFKLVVGTAVTMSKISVGVLAGFIGLGIFCSIFLAGDTISSPLPPGYSKNNGIIAGPNGIVIGGPGEAWDEFNNTNVDWTHHGYKHFPQKNMTWSDIVKSTKYGPAKYSNKISDIEKFEREAWKSGITVKTGKNWKVKEFDNVIGACDGKETRFMRIENSHGTIHGHPISEEEFKKLSGE